MKLQRNHVQRIYQELHDEHAVTSTRWIQRCHEKHIHHENDDGTYDQFCWVTVYEWTNEAKRCKMMRACLSHGQSRRVKTQKFLRVNSHAKSIDGRKKAIQKHLQHSLLKQG